MLSVEGIGKKMRDGLWLKDISFRQERQQYVAIAGETGSGKSTLLKIISGLAQPDEGRVIFEGERVLGPDEQLIAGHPRIAFLSQHFELRNNYWVHEVLEYANKIGKDAAEQIFHICGIDHLLGRRTHELSGGEKQRIATARLLINQPSLLLLDEPYSNLDMIHKHTMKKLLRDVSDQLSISSILVSHEPADVLSWADVLILMRDGKIIQQGSPEELYRSPVSEYAAGLLGTYYMLPSGLVSVMGAKVKPGMALIRPEGFEVQEWEGIEARVTKVSFLGSRFTYNARVGDVPISFYYDEKLEVGAAVRLGIRRGSITWISY